MPERKLTADETRKQLRVALSRNRRLERKAAASNTENVELRREIKRLTMENRIQHGWLNAEESYTRRYKALEARVGIIRDVLAERFPEEYGQPGAYNWFGTGPKDQ